MNVATNNLTAVITSAPKAAPKGRKGKPAADSWQFDANRYGQLGQEMATAAAAQTQSAVNYWDRCRTLYVEAQAHGAGQEAIAALFGPGEKVKGKKAPWFRTYKSILVNALSHGVTIGNDMGMTAAQKAVKIAKEDGIDNDPVKAEAKTSQLVEMFTKLAQGCLNRGVSKAQLATILKGLEA